MEWIDICDRKPETGGRYLVVYYGGGIAIEYWSIVDKCFYDENSQVADITHWQPLPKLP